MRYPSSTVVVLLLTTTSFVHGFSRPLSLRQQPRPGCIECGHQPSASSSRKACRSLHLSQPHIWTPQDLTQNNPGFPSIPDNDYIKLYQANPHQLWPVEFFVIPYRRNGKETQILVRPSANGTSKWGLGTGVPVTRWLLSTASLPFGYAWKSSPKVTFEANNYPEFPKDDTKSWTYRKIDICRDVFHDSSNPDLYDPELQQYAQKIHKALQTHLANSRSDDDSWESIRRSVIQSILDDDRSIAAIQGTLRMSGLFAPKEGDTSSRYMSLDAAPDPTKLIESMRVYTMFPQMPDPMPLPFATAEELKEELLSREARMAQIGRDPHKDRYGRVFTHKSTSNVSNTIHGTYFPIDVTELLDSRDAPTAWDLFGTKRIPKQWNSLQDLDVLTKDGTEISTTDPKPTFISGFIVRQLVREGIINI